MFQQAAGERFFHVIRSLPYNRNPPLIVGMTFEAGRVHNPFFGFYESGISVPVDTPQGRVNVKALRFLAAVKNGEVASTTLPVHAHEIATHYLMLARELIMEEVRKEANPNFPSRQSCLWVVETIEQARIWKQRLGGVSSIVGLELNGFIFKADAGWLLGDSEPLSLTYDRARSYWAGEVSDSPEPEVLFKGSALVREINLI